MKILVVQMARLGDILQTLPTIQSLRRLHPKAEISVVVRSTFSDAAKLSTCIDKLIEFPSNEILGPSIQDRTNNRKLSLGRLSRWIQKNLSEKYDLCLNLTFSDASSYLTGMVDATEKRGMNRAIENGSDQLVISDAWSQYFYSQVLGKNLNMIHLNDLFLRIANAGAGAWPLTLNTQALEKAPTLNKFPDDKFIGVQLRASQPNKTLHADAWKKVCSTILEKTPQVHLVFFGSKEDVSFIEEVSAELDQNRVMNVAGTCKFHEMVHMVRSCDYVVSPDTAMVHLTSICGTKVIEIAVGPVNPIETGPYGFGHHVIYPVHPDATRIGNAITQIINGETLDQSVAAVLSGFITCTNGIIRNEHTPINFTQDEISNFFTKAYYLLAEFRCSGRQEDIEIPKFGDPAQIGALDRLIGIYDTLCTTRRLSEYGSHYCLEMLEKFDDKNAMRDLLQKIAEIESLLTTIQNSVSFVKPLIDTWRISKDVAPVSATAGFDEIIALTEGSYRELGQNIDIIQQLLQVAIDASQKKVAEKAESNGGLKENLNENNSN